METNGWTPSRFPPDLDIPPRYSVAPSRAEGLEPGLFGGEPRSQSLHGVLLRAAVANLTGGEDAIQKAIPETFYRCGHAGDLNDVNAGADNHRKTR